MTSRPRGATRRYGESVPARQGGLPGAPAEAYSPDMNSMDADRERRLAESLRQNLRRRKAQARAMDALPERDENTPEPGAEDADRPT
jgi:hypothetical protein